MNKLKNKKNKNKKEKESKVIPEEASESESKSNISQISEESSDSSKRDLHLTKIVLENFKSFEGRHEIGLFLNFTVVMGPNGSGKSNIIDAMCFALGMTLHSLRTKNLRDLIYKPCIDSPISQKKTCFVELIFTELGTELSFKRCVTQNGSNQFIFNGTKITQEDYLHQLEIRNIPSHAMYFILAQGAIDSLLSKKNDLCQTIELLSGSYTLKEEYEQLTQEIMTKNEEIAKLSTQKNLVKDDKNKVKNQIENEKTYNELIDKVNNIITKIYLYRLAEQDSISEACKDNLKQNLQEMANVQDEKKGIIDKIKENEISIKKNEGEMKILFEENNKYKTQTDLLKNKINIIVDKIKSHEGSIFTKISSLNQIKADQAKKAEKKIQLTKLKTTLQNEIDKIKAILDADVDLSSLNVTKEQIKEYKSIQLSFQSKTTNNFKLKDSLNLELSELNTKKNLIEKSLSQIETEKNKASSEVQSLTQNISLMKTNLEALTKESKEQKYFYSKLNSKLTSLDAEYNSLYIELQEKLGELSQYEIDTFENSKKKKISELMNKNEKVFGFLYELITPLQKKLELPIKISLLKYLNHLVVEDSATALIVSDFLKGKEISCDVLVLENIPKRETDESIRLQLGSLGNLLVDLIDCKKKGLKNAINFFLKNMILCHDVNNVKALREKGFTSIILIDGTIYKKTSIKGGTYKNLNQYTFNYSTYANASTNENIKKLKTEIEILTTRLKEIEQEREQNNNESKIKQKIIENENTIIITTKNIQLKEEELKKQAEKFKNLEKNYNNCENSLAEIDEKIEEINIKIAKNEKEITQIKNEFYASFLKKHNLSSLKDFEKFSLNEMQKLSDDLKIKEEKMLILNNTINNLSNIEETIEKAQEQLQILKNEKTEFEKEKKNIEEEMKKVTNEYEQYKKEHNTSITKVDEMKNSIQKGYEEIEKIDKRIRNLIKNKIETEHKILNAFNSKKQILFEAKTDNDKLLKDLGEVYKNSSIILALNYNLERYVLRKELEENNIENIVIDYSDLEKKMPLNERTTQNLQEKINQNKEKLTTMLKEIEKYVKNIALNESESNKLKTKEDELVKQKKELESKINALINEQEKKKEQLSKIKTSRKKKFQKFFEKFQNILGETYKKITTSENSPGGNAFIYNTNEDEPYNGNICYLPTPPGKRVIYDIEQLSGGEKTLAIVSLLVSLQKISETPFLILDEVDAYLDPEHELVLEKLFQSLKDQYQVIIVTHKNTIFRSAQSLIGTFFNKQKFTSIPLSLDMTCIY